MYQPSVSIHLFLRAAFLPSWNHPMGYDTLKNIPLYTTKGRRQNIVHSLKNSFQDSTTTKSLLRKTAHSIMRSQGSTRAHYSP